MIRAFIALLVLGLSLQVGGGFAVPMSALALQTTSTAETSSSFTSEQFGYQLQWETPWIAFEPVVFELLESVILQDERKMASCTTLSAHGGQMTFSSPQEVLDVVVSGLITDVQDAAVETTDREAAVTWAQLTYTGPHGPARSFVEVFALPEADAYLYTIVEAPLDEFEEALNQAAGSIRLDGNLFVAQERTSQTGEAPSGGSLRDQSPTGATGAESIAAVQDAVSPSYRGGPAHTGEQPGPAPMTPAQVAWSFATGDTFVGATPPVVSPELGMVFTSSNAVYAVDIISGQEVWRHTSEFGLGFVAPLVLADGVLYAASEDGHLYAFEPASGTVIWRSAVTGGLAINGGPLVVGDALYVSAWDMSAYALDRQSGSVRWSQPIGGISFGQPAMVDGWLVLPGPSSGQGAFSGMLGLETESGEEVWRFATDADVMPAPAIANGVVFVGDQSGVLYAVDVASGVERWRVNTGAAIRAAPAVANGVAYVVTDASLLAAYDATSGSPLWSVTVAGTDLGGISVTTAQNGTPLILLGDGQGVLHAFDATGVETYTVNVTSAPISFPPTVVNNVIYVPANDGSVYALSVAG